MRSFLAIVQRELRAYFVSPMAWVVLTFFLLVNGISFSMILGFLSESGPALNTTPFAVFFNSFLFWFVTLFATPVITMRLIAEERRSGTIEPLMTAPVSDTQIILAKFSSALVFFLFLWLPTLLYPLIVGRYMNVDWGPLASGYLGVVGTGSLFLAVGLLCSTLSRNQILAAVSTFGLLMVLFIGPWIGELVRNEALSQALAYINLIDHMDQLSSGIVDTRRLVYYVTATTFFLFLATRALATRKWR